MKHAKEELAKIDSRNWLWFKTFKKAFLLNILKTQDFFLTWRNHLHSAEFWNISWLWISFLMKICSLRIRFAIGQGAKKKLMHWMSSRVPKRYLERGFPSCFRDGILLCAVTEKLSPGACPRFDLLDPEQPIRNLKLALYLIEKHIKIKPGLTADEIVQGGKFPEKRLLLLVAQMKLASEKFKLPATITTSKKDFMSQTTFVSDKCFARGMGLLLAVRGRKACFTILLDSTENLDMVIEIRGPRNTACNKRITNIHCLPRSESADLKDIMDAQVKEDILSKIIPLTYRIIGRKISVSYTPLESGSHNMSIIWQGQHIMGSPYTITVDSSVESPDIWFAPSTRGYCRLKRSDSQYIDESVEYSNQTTSNLSTCLENSSSAVRKKILRYIVRVDGNDVVIDGKEDLCDAINNIKQKLRNASSHADDHKDTCKQNVLSDIFEQKENCLRNVFPSGEERKEILQQNAFLYNGNHKKNCQQNTSLYSEQGKETCERNAFLHIEEQKEICKQHVSSHTEEQKETCQQNLLWRTKERKEMCQRNVSLQNENDKEKSQRNPLSIIKDVYESHICSNSDAKVLESSFNCCEILCPENDSFIMNDLTKSEIDQNTTMNSKVFKLSKKLDSQESENEDMNLKSFKEKITTMHLDSSTHPRLTINKEVMTTINGDANRDNNRNNKQYSELENSNLVTNIKPYSFPECLENCTVLDKNHEAEERNASDVIYCNSDPYNPVVSVLNEKNSEFQFKCRNLNMCSNLDLNLNVNTTPVFLNVNDDINLFPVHKVEYEVLHEEDEEDQDEFNPRRRRSFTELHESNYLDDDNNELGSSANAVDISFNINEGTEENFKDERLKCEEVLSNSSVESDSKSSIKANFSLFECDHSLTFWTETVNETPPDLVYGSGDHESISEKKIFEMWENKLRELENESSAPDEELFLEMKPNENNEMEYVKTDSYLIYPREFNENSDNIISFPSQSFEKMCDDVQLDAKKLNERDLSDHWKRLSWSEKGSLPCIQESSVEMYSESETCSENINGELCEVFNKTEMKENLSAICNELGNTSIEVKFDENVESGTNLINQNAFNSHADNWIERFNNKDTDYRLQEKSGDFLKSPAGGESKNTVMSMNILSASPYRNRSKEVTSTEAKNSAVTNLKNSPQQLPVAIEPLVSPKSNIAPENYILTYATPAVINDCLIFDGEMNTSCEFDNGKNPDEAPHVEKYSEQKSAQCLSVKKVIEIFQKEKEEPIDTWPVVVPNTKSPSFHKKCEENWNAGVSAKHDLPVNEIFCFSSSSDSKPPVEISHSSIKDRVKLFENDAKEKYYPMKKNSSIEKCSNITVSAKKNYWESMTS